MYAVRRDLTAAEVMTTGGGVTGPSGATWTSVLGSRPVPSRLAPATFVGRSDRNRNIFWSELSNAVVCNSRSKGSLCSQTWWLQEVDGRVDGIRLSDACTVRNDQ